MTESALRARIQAMSVDAPDRERLLRWLVDLTLRRQRNERS